MKKHALVDLLLVLQPRKGGGGGGGKKSLSACPTASLMQKWAWLNGMWAWSKIFARNYVYGPPQPSTGSYAYVLTHLAILKLMTMQIGLQNVLVD